MICFDENPQRQNVEEDRRGYGGGSRSPTVEELAVERERAKKRQEEMGRNHGEDTSSGKVSKTSDEGGSARDKAAEKVNADGSGKGSSDLTNHDQDEGHDSWERAAEKTDFSKDSLSKGKQVKDKLSEGGVQNASGSDLHEQRWPFGVDSELGASGRSWRSRPFEEMLEIEKRRGEEPQGPNSSKNLLESEGDAKTRAAEKINADVSGRFEERACGPSRLPHVSHRGGEHSHG